ncbi:heavy metal-binding domain-containing protein [Streptomyces sp. NPDC093707]|uniref:heavy metal-binding domain-containing protein n=1 Tax=Streptomyces sp. NPDC093707 TaxID=3154984 RepID=UPI0034508315
MEGVSMGGEWFADGGLPPVAAARTAEARQRGTWSSALSTGEFAAIRSVGFEPVGQVLGTAVYRVAGRAAGWSYYDCGYQNAGWSSRRSAPAGVAVSGQGAASKTLVDVLLSARHAALGRMIAECTALGGDGVVAADLTMAPFPAAPHCFEFQVIGTAVRAQGQVRPRRPFTTHLDGQGFAKLIAAGWVPVELLVGLAIGTRHDDWTTRRQNWFAAGNQEVTGWSRLVALTRHDARRQIGEQAWHTGADGVVLGDNRLRVWEEACFRARRRNNDSDQKDHVAEATLIGTAVAAFTTRQAPPRTLTVMPLDPKRRRPRPA